jgi:deoxyribodipyrimidine photo-lyase
MTGGTLVWLRQDLRLSDNRALAAAVQRGGPILPVYIWAPEEEGNWPPGAASRWWLHQSLAQLATALQRRGSQLILRRGPTQAALQEVLAHSGATAVYWNRRYEPAAQARDAQVAAALRRHGVEVEDFSDALLFEPGTVLTAEGRPFQVFTPFWKACLAQGVSAVPQAAPARLPAPRSWPASLPLAEFRLEPTVDWAAGLRASWQPGEAGAQTRLQQFLEEALANYATDRDRPDRLGTSRLSPHLHFGEISIRQVWHAVWELAHQRHLPAASVSRFTTELGWREFAYHLLCHFPDTPEQPLRRTFRAFPWEAQPEGLRAWQRGRTGYPLVDAGMRQLWRSGWMHNRLRMVVASFLVKDLLISWREGAAWFWDTLVDADLANNTLGWQWTAGCGADAAPYFRIFHPVRQGERFDPQGEYVRRWVPELARLPAAWIHRPWEAPPAVLRAAGVELGRTYPRPIVDHAQARTRALAAWKQMRPAGLFPQDDEDGRRP